MSHSKKISIHTIQSISLLQIAKALLQIIKKNTVTSTYLPYGKTLKKRKKIKRVIEKEFLTPLEETRLTIEEVVIPQHLTIDLLPRRKPIRKLQHELISHYQLKGISVGTEPNRRLRIYPK